MTRVLFDLSFSLRQMRKHRGFTLSAMITLAIGIGASTAIFSLVDAVLLRPLPYAHPERVMSIDTMIRGNRVAGEHFASWPDFYDLRRGARSMSAIAACQNTTMTIGQPGTALRRITGTIVSSGMAAVLGVRLQRGSDFTEKDELAGNRSVILSDTLWQDELNRDPHAVGKTIQLDGRTFTVIGVLPPGFLFPGQDDSQFWITEGLEAEGKDPETQSRGDHMLEIIGRLAAGVTREAAAAELTRIQLDLNKRYPDTDAQNERIDLVPLAESLAGDVRGPLQILLAAVGFLLLIACANVAGLTLTRAVARQAELAVRAALGASRFVLLRQLILEALILALSSGVLGIALAFSMIRIAPRFLLPSLPHAATLSLDARVVLFTLAASLASALTFGVLPAWRSSQQEPAGALRSEQRGSTPGRGRHRLHGALVVAETALSVVLLIGAALLIESFVQVTKTDPGFDPNSLLTFRIAVPQNHFTPEQTARFSQQLQSELASLPGVQSATSAYPLPLTGGNLRTGFDIPGRPQPPGRAFIARLSCIGPDYFQTLGIPLLSGRPFSTPELLPAGPPAVIVNQAFAHQYFPDQQVLGKRIGTSFTQSGGRQEWQIVGVVSNVKRRDFSEDASPEFYLPTSRSNLGTPIFAVRAKGDPLALADSIRLTVAQTDPAIPIYNVSTYDGLIHHSLALRRFQAILLATFATIALVLATVGLYASLSYMVAERTAELGLRIALGAQRQDVLGLVLRRGLSLSVYGIVAGLAGSAIIARLVSGFLYRTAPIDLSTYGFIAVLLLAVSAASSWLPAWRAAHIQPLEALRSE